MTTARTWNTPDALKIAGVDPVRWNNAVARAGLPAPATVQGQARTFTVDDIIVLQVFQGFVDVGATPQWAAKIAHAVHTALRQNTKARAISICKEIRADGTPDMVVYEKPPPDANVIFPMDLQRYRRTLARSTLATETLREANRSRRGAD